MNLLRPSPYRELESALHCIVSQNPSSWSTQLSWIEKAHISLTSFATGLSPFEVSLGYQPPIFPENDFELTIPSVQHHLQCFKCFSGPENAISNTASAAKLTLITNWDRRCGCLPGTFLSQPGFSFYWPVWDWRCNQTAVFLKLPASLRIPPMFHISQIKPVLYTLTSVIRHSMADTFSSGSCSLRTLLALVTFSSSPCVNKSLVNRLKVCIESAYGSKPCANLGS